MGLGQSSGMSLEISNQLDHTLEYDHDRFEEICGKVAKTIIMHAKIGCMHGGGISKTLVYACRSPNAHNMVSTELARTFLANTARM